MIKILCSIFIKKTPNSLIFSMIKYPPYMMLGEAFFIVKIVLQRYYKFLKYTSICLIFCKYFVF